LKKNKNRFSKKVLIVEDDKILRDLLKLRLESQFEVLGTADGVTGLDLCESHQPDLVLLDVNLPELDGGEFCDRVRKNLRYGRPKILIMTGLVSNSQEFLPQWKNLYQVDDFFVKPFDPSKVVNRVKELLDA